MLNLSTALVPSGHSRQGIVVLKGWAIRRARYGDHGTPNHRERKKTHCCRGHAFTPENTKMYRGTRRCRACEDVRRPRASRQRCPRGHKYTAENTIVRPHSVCCRACLRISGGKGARVKSLKARVSAARRALASEHPDTSGRHRFWPKVFQEYKRLERLYLAEVAQMRRADVRGSVSFK